MSRIRKTFEKLNGKKALVGFVTAGDPTIEKSLEIIEEMCRRGLDVLELGVPFSDPTADGPVIQRSSTRAIGSGVNLRAVIEMVRKIRGFSTIPVVVFTYYNPIIAYGTEAFCRDAVDAGADGLLVVDLPPEESDELTDILGDGLDLIRLIAPTTPPERMKRIAEKASGFLYLVSMTGVTGAGGIDHNELASVADQLKEACKDLPVCVGFGISTPRDVVRVAPLCDGVVVGSAFERAIEESLAGNPVDNVGKLVASLKKALPSAIPAENG
ncbi:MAG: tryptophan synthase subunit alpha [Desulfobacteraceae bacterium]|nr:tryptophan synthase subunit alpha [Desulfobacteraceae bacterium]